MSRKITPDFMIMPNEEKIESIRNSVVERKNRIMPMQVIFVNHLVECNMDISIAAQRSGVKLHEARKWVENEGPVANLIEERLRELSLRTNVTVEAIIAQLWEEATRQPADLDDKTVSHAARVSALSHLARFKGMFDKGGKGHGAKVKVNINVGGSAQISGGETIDG